MTNFWRTAVLSTALLAPVLFVPSAVRAQDRPEAARSYHDDRRNEDHEWNGQEDRAYRIYARQNHRRYREFTALRENERQAYWGWRRTHSDARLRIVIRP